MAGSRRGSTSPSPKQTITDTDTATHTSIVGFFLALLFVPETKALSLEELDQVFSVPTHVHAAYQVKSFKHTIQKYVFRMKVDPLPPLYEHEGAIGEKHYAPGGAGHA